MESRLHGVSLSATQMNPKVPVSGSLSGIRAPLTMDDSDFEYSRSHKSSSVGSYGSGSEMEYEGFVSGEDEIESSSERQFETDPDEEIVEETHFVNEYVFSRPGFNSPDEEIVRKSSYDSEYMFSRPSVKSPDEETVQERNSFNKFHDYRLSLSDRDEVIVEDELNDVDIGISVLPRMAMPIAMVSADSDDDSPRSVAMDNDVNSAIVRAPSVAMLQRVDTAPKVRISEEEEEEEDDELQSDGVVGAEFVEDLLPKSNFNDILNSKYAEHEGNESQSHEVVEPELVDDSTPKKQFNGVLSSKYEECSNLEDNVHEGVDTIEGAAESKSPEVVEPELVEDSTPKKQFSGVLSSKCEECSNLEDNVREGANTIGGGGESKFLPESKESDYKEELLSCADATQLDEESCSIRKIVDGENSVQSDSSSDCESNDLRSCVNEETKEHGLHESLNPSLQDMDEVVLLDDRSCRNNNIDIDEHADKGEQNIDCTVASHENISPGLNESVNDSQDEHMSPSSTLEQQTEQEEDNGAVEFLGEVEDSIFDNENERDVGIEELNQPIMIQSEEEVDDDEDNGKNVIDPSSLAAFLKAVTDAASDNVKMKFTSFDESKVISPELASNHTVSSVSDDCFGGEEKQKDEKIRQLRVAYLQLVHRFGRSADDLIVTQTLHHLTLAEGKHPAQGFSHECAKATAMELEEQTENHQNFSLNILVIGKTGVGKSATINSIFGEKKVSTDAFQPETTKVNEIIGSINGVKIHILDTPGLRTSFTEQSINWKILSSIKKFTRKCPPDIVLYVDRVDIQANDLADLAVLKSVTTHLGPSIWHNAVIALTHSASTLPDGPTGSPSSYDVFVAQRSQVVQQLISRSAGDMRVMNPVALVENQFFNEMNKDGETMLPNRDIWRSKLLLLFYSIKTLSELNYLVRNPNPLDCKHHFGFRISSAYMPYFCSSLLQSNGGNLEVHLREKEYLVGKDESSLGVSVRRWRDYLIWDCNLESQFSIGRVSKVNVRAGLSNKLSGLVSVKISSSELQIAVLCILPIAKAIFKNVSSHPT